MASVSSALCLDKSDPRHDGAQEPVKDRYVQAAEKQMYR